MVNEPIVKEVEVKQDGNTYFSILPDWGILNKVKLFLNGEILLEEGNEYIRKDRLVRFSTYLNIESGLDWIEVRCNGK